MCKPSEPIELRLEPKNPADPRAVAVYSCRDVQIGYLTAERAPWIGGMIRNGRQITAIFQRRTSYGALIRIAFDGVEPTLPFEREQPSPDEVQREGFESGFWPDEEWPGS